MEQFEYSDTMGSSSHRHHHTDHDHPGIPREVSMMLILSVIVVTMVFVAMFSYLSMMVQEGGFAREAAASETCTTGEFSAAPAPDGYYWHQSCAKTCTILDESEISGDQTIHEECRPTEFDPNVYPPTSYWCYSGRCLQLYSDGNGPSAEQVAQEARDADDDDRSDDRDNEREENDERESERDSCVAVRPPTSAEVEVSRAQLNDADAYLVTQNDEDPDVEYLWAVSDEVSSRGDDLCSSNAECSDADENIIGWCFGFTDGAACATYAGQNGQEGQRCQVRDYDDLVAEMADEEEEGRQTGPGAGADPIAAAPDDEGDRSDIRTSQSRLLPTGQVRQNEEADPVEVERSTGGTTPTETVPQPVGDDRDGRCMARVQLKEPGSDEFLALDRVRIKYTLDGGGTRTISKAYISAEENKYEHTPSNLFEHGQELTVSASAKTGEAVTQREITLAPDSNNPSICYVELMVSEEDSPQLPGAEEEIEDHAIVFQNKRDHAVTIDKLVVTQLWLNGSTTAIDVDKTVSPNSVYHEKTLLAAACGEGYIDGIANPIVLISYTYHIDRESPYSINPNNVEKPDRRNNDDNSYIFPTANYNCRSGSYSTMYHEFIIE